MQANNLSFTFPVSRTLAVGTFMNHWLLMGHWLFQSQQERGEGAAGSPKGTQTRGRSIIHGSPWACSEHWHPTCLNQTGPVSLMPLGKCEAQVKVGVMREVKSGVMVRVRSERTGGRGNEEVRECPLLLHWLLLESCQRCSCYSSPSSFFLSVSLFVSFFRHSKSYHKGLCYISIMKYKIFF